MPSSPPKSHDAESTTTEGPAELRELEQRVRYVFGGAAVVIVLVGLAIGTSPQVVAPALGGRLRESDPTAGP